jgi:hypothetical protein
MKKPIKPNLHIVKSIPSNMTQPPRKLGQHGCELWKTIMSEYQVSDSGGIEILAQICCALDTAELMAEQVRRDGPMLLCKGMMKEHPGLKHELACRAFIVRGIEKLGLNVEVVKNVGRPPGGY